MFNLPNRTYFSRKRESIELDILNNSNSEQLLYRRNIISKSHRIKSFNYDQHIIQNKFQVQAINRNEEIKNLIKQYDIISKLTAFGWCLFATLLILISIIGFKIPNQTTGYACLKTRTCSSQEVWSKLYGMCKYVENTTCTNRTDCLEPMTCTANNICQCGPFQYHNFPTLTCLPQESYLGSCSVDFNCRVDKYLQCVSGACQCISAYPVWSDGFDTCIVPRIYNQYCYVNSDCNAGLNLACQDGTYNCTCPLNLAFNYCDCKRALNNEYYWNGSSCILAGKYGDSCVADYQCKMLTESLSCDTCGGTYKCVCANGIYDFTKKSCVPCATNWFAHNNACYKGAWCPPEFDLITQAQINNDTYCGTVPGYNVVLAPGPFSIIDANCWLSDVCSPFVDIQANQAVNMYYYGPVLDAFSSCSVVTCPAGLSTHSCNHGAGHHGIVCMYT